MASRIGARKALIVEGIVLLVLHALMVCKIKARMVLIAADLVLRAL
jgi:hypothetical protein